MQYIGESGVTNIISDIRTLADTRVNKTVKPIFSDDSIRRMVQRASNDLYYLLVQIGVPYNTVKTTFSGISVPSNPNNNAIYRLPDSFYKVLVFLYRTDEGSDQFFLIPEGKLKDAYDGYKTSTGFGYSVGNRTYLVISRATGDELTIVPQGSVSEGDQYYLEYIPDAPDVSDLRVPKGWVDYLVYAGAAELGSADYNLIQMWAEKAAKLRSDIEGWALNRSPNESQKINRVQTQDLTIEQINNQTVSFLDPTLIP